MLAWNQKNFRIRHYLLKKIFWGHVWKYMKFHLICPPQMDGPDLIIVIKSGARSALLKSIKCFTRKTHENIYYWIGATMNKTLKWSVLRSEGGITHFTSVVAIFSEYRKIISSFTWKGIFFLQYYHDIFKIWSYLRYKDFFKKNLNIFNTTEIRQKCQNVTCG